MRLHDTRRLTGPNLHLRGPGAISEVTFADGEDRDAAIARWRERATRALTALGWPAELVTRVHAHGADLVLAAPVDALYLAADVQDWAVGGPTDLEEELPAWREALAREHTPARAALLTAAAARDIPVMLDDDALSLGHGRRSVTWLKGQLLPGPEAVDWSALGRIPVALVTGTNGKTTTARMLARIARTAGVVPGNTSTDGMSVDERVIEEGDWTGPGAARIVLRHPDVDLAVLEVARGGILRRGLAVDRCGAAVVTNVSADHLGEYGVDDLATMARVKAVVGSVVADTGRVVLGADSQPLVDLVAAGHPFPAPIAWFALSGDHPRLLAHRAAAGEAWYVSESGDLTRARGPHADAIVPVAELPSSFGGAAEHNVLNALAAAALASALGLPDAAIAAGLRSFRDNPGRAALFHVGDARVLLDFAHNPGGIRSIRKLLASLRGDRRLLVGIGVAGDRRDDDIRDVARAVHELAPDRVIVRDLEHYLRGRAPGEVPELLRRTLINLGTPADAVEAAPDELEILTRGLAWAEPGDLVAILVHVDREQIQRELQRLGAR
jgi:cyanophycin synthetase